MAGFKSPTYISIHFNILILASVMLIGCRSDSLAVCTVAQSLCSFPDHVSVVRCMCSLVWHLSHVCACVCEGLSWFLIFRFWYESWEFFDCEFCIFAFGVYFFLRFCFFIRCFSFSLFLALRSVRNEEVFRHRIEMIIAAENLISDWMNGYEMDYVQDNWWTEWCALHVGEIQTWLSPANNATSDEI